MAVELEELYVGCKVSYINANGTVDKGIVKAIDHKNDTCFVVYNCNEDWENYEHYTGVNTRVDYIKVGWPGDFENYFTHTDLYLFEEIKAGKSVMYFFLPHEELNSMELKFLSKVLSETFPFDPCDLDTSNLEEIFKKRESNKGFPCLVIFRSDVEEWGFSWCEHVNEYEMKMCIETSGFESSLSPKENLDYIDLNKIYNRKVGMAPAISNNQIIEFLEKYGS